MIIEMFGMLLEEVKDCDDDSIEYSCEACDLREICDTLYYNNKPVPCNVTCDTRTTGDRHFVEVKLNKD